MSGVSRPLTRSAILYSWQQLVRRAGITQILFKDKGFDCLGIKVRYEVPEQAADDQLTIFVKPCSNQAYHHLLNGLPRSLNWLPVKQVIPAASKLLLPGENIPVLFWSSGYEDGHKPFAERRDDGIVIFYVDIIAATFFMLSRWEETVVKERDEHERFRATASVAYKQGFLDRPIVDEYALILREWIKLLLPQWKPDSHHFTVKLSHDIDHLARFPNVKAGLRVFAGDVIKRRNLSHARQTITDLWHQSIDPEQTPQLQGIRELAGLSAQYKLQSAFYFMAADPSFYDSGYDPTSPIVRRYIQDLLIEGHEIGFHPGYYTFDNFDCLAAEKARLDQVLGMTEYGGRQHYLRFKAPDTWRFWEQLGLIYDSTVGYADHEGFRCGTCHPFQPFDCEQDRELNLWEYPLIVMDGTLAQYRNMDPKQGENVILGLADCCRQVDGIFTLLWHNSSLDQNWLEMYKRVIRVLASMQANVQ